MKKFLLGGILASVLLATPSVKADGYATVEFTGKDNVVVSGNNNLVAEKTNIVKVVVTAENGSAKTYTLKVTRGKDPNKKLSSNNYLSYLKPSVGILSPVYDKDVNNYVIYLPYEIDKIAFDYAPIDTVYASIKTEGALDLQAGIANVYKIIVTAESEEERVYTITINRAQKLGQEGNNNIYLKSLKLKDGKLLGKFNKKQYEYYYNRGKNFKIEEMIPEDSNSAVSVFEDGTNIHIIVVSSSGEYGVYTLREKDFNILPYIVAVITLIIGFFLGNFITRTIIKKRSI